MAERKEEGGKGEGALAPCTSHPCHSLVCREQYSARTDDAENILPES